MYLIWAYHSTSDVQPGQFAKHSYPGFREVTLIAAATTPTPGTLVICSQLEVLHIGCGA